MKSVLYCALAAALTLAPTLAAEDMPMNEEMMMQMMMKHSTPGDMHSKLSRFVGKWEFSANIYYGGPEMPPQTSPGTAEFTSLYGGRFVQQQWKSTMMGRPIEGMMQFGYDNFKKKFVCVNMDDMSTSIGRCEGLLTDPAGETLVFYGTMDEYMTGEHDKPVKMVYRWTGPDAFTFEIWDMLWGENGTRVMEIPYKRVK